MQPDEYTLRTYESANGFLDDCFSWLKASGVLNGSIVSVAQAIIAGKTVFGESHWFGSVLRDQRIEGCAIYEQLDGLMITQLPNGAHEKLAASVTTDGLQIEKIYGPERDLEILAQAFRIDTSCSWSVTHRWDCYAATSLEESNSSIGGALRQADESDREMIKLWANQYSAEKPAPIPIGEFLLRKMRDGDLYIWDHLGPKTMLSLTKHSASVAKISAAFTPMEFRGRGYASAAVASITNSLLENGYDYISLMVEAGADHLHRMYDRLGFQRQGRRVNMILSRE